MIIGLISIVLKKYINQDLMSQKLSRRLFLNRR